MEDILLKIVLGILGSTAVWQTITWFVDRYDKRKTSKEDILKEIEKVNGEVKKISIKVDDLSFKVDENQAVLSRTHILRFSDEIRNGVVHSNDYWRQQMQDCDTYERFCEEHPDFKNNYTDLANKYIKTTYEKLLQEKKL